MTDEELCFDPWTVRELETDDMGHEHWDEDDCIDLMHNDDQVVDDEDDESDENTIDEVAYEGHDNDEDEDEDDDNNEGDDEE
jgi:hypothetical protein